MRESPIRSATACRDCSTLTLKATRGVAILVVPPRQRKWRQPGFAPGGPDFVGWLQLVGGIQRSEVHFDFVSGARKHGRAASGAEEPALVVAGFAGDRHRVLRKDGGGVEKRSMMLAAVEAMTQADPVWPA